MSLPYEACPPNPSPVDPGNGIELVAGGYDGLLAFLNLLLRYGARIDSTDIVNFLMKPSVCLHTAGPLGKSANGPQYCSKSNEPRNSLNSVVVKR